MAFTGQTFGGPTVYYITPQQIALDNNGWNVRDVASTGATYYGYTQTSTDQTKAVWKIRKDVTQGKVTTVQYAITTGNTYGQYNFAWTGRTSLTYK